MLPNVIEPPRPEAKRLGQTQGPGLNLRSETAVRRGPLDIQQHSSTFTRQL